MRAHARFLLLASVWIAILPMLGCQREEPQAAVQVTPTATTSVSTPTAPSTATPVPTATATHTPQPTATATSTATFTPTPTPTATPTATATPLPSAVIRVTDELTGAPVAQAAVRLQSPTAGAGPDQVCDSAGETRIAVLQTGTYSVTVSAEGYFSRTVALEIGQGENPLAVVLAPRTIARLTADSANLRSGPGTIYDAQGAMKQGDALDVVGRSEDGTWLVVAAPNGLHLWLWAELAAVEGPMEHVEIAAAPPTPTPAATLTPTPTPAPSYTIFPETGWEPWNAEAFLVRLGQIHEAFFKFKVSFFIYPDCGKYGLLRVSCVTAAAYTDVPADWQDLYLEYRFLLQRTIEVTKPVDVACNTPGGGYITVEQKDAIAEVIDKGELRLIEMKAEAARRLGK